MKQLVRKNLSIFCAGFLCAFVGLATVHGATITLIAYVTSAILDHTGSPLADGSVIAIMGSGDAVNDGFPTVGGTNLVSNQTLGDDVIVGWIEINSTFFNSNGTFFSANLTFDDTQVSYFYLRVWEYTNDPAPTGLLYYTETTPTGYVSFFDIAIVDFGSGIETTNRDNFVVIPEPSSVNLLAVMLAVVIGMRASLRGKARAGLAKLGQVYRNEKMPDRF